jgi:hypothetical protein
LLVTVAFCGGAYVQSKVNIASTVVAVYTKLVTFVKAVVAKVQALFTKKA